MGDLHSAYSRENSREKLKCVIRPGFQREKVFSILRELAVVFLDRGLQLRRVKFQFCRNVVKRLHWAMNVWASALLLSVELIPQFRQRLSCVNVLAAPERSAMLVHVVHLFLGYD